MQHIAQQYETEAKVANDREATVLDRLSILEHGLQVHTENLEAQNKVLNRLLRAIGLES